MMRILRLYAPSLIGDHTLCYVSTNREGNVCINDVEIPVLWARAGEPLDSEERAAAMTVVLPPDAKLNEGGERLLVTVVAFDDGTDVVGGDGVLAQADEPARDSPRVAALLRGQPLAKKLCERDHRGLLLLREFLCHGTSRANEASV